MSNAFSHTSSQTMMIDGPVGQLELLTTAPSLSEPSSYVAIICHPHPLFQGTMHNKVVTTLAKSVSDVMPTIRFNFRGVGQSGGSYGAGVGECDDLRAVMAWAQEQHKGCQCILMGFSFGAGVAAAVANETSLALLLTVAPSVSHSHLHTLTGIRCPWVMIFAGNDEVVDANETRQFIQSPASKLSQVIELPEASHFFHGELVSLKSQVQHAINQELKDVVLTD